MTNAKDNELVELQDLGSGHWRAVCGDRSFRTEERNGDLWVDHRELARFVGHDPRRGPGKLLEVLRNCLKIGLVNDSEACPFNGSVLIKRKAALLLMTRCNMPRAIELTRKMADVFEKYLDRRHRADQNNAMQTFSNAIVKIQEQQGQIVTAVVHLTERIVVIEERLSSQGNLRGLITPARKREILDGIQFLADCFYNRKTHRKEWNSKRGYFEKEARKACLLPMGVGWDRLPAARDDLVENKLRDFRECIPEEVRRQRRTEREHAKQMTFRAVN